MEKRLNLLSSVRSCFHSATTPCSPRLSPTAALSNKNVLLSSLSCRLFSKGALVSLHSKIYLLEKKVSSLRPSPLFLSSSKYFRDEDSYALSLLFLLQNKTCSLLFLTPVLHIVELKTLFPETWSLCPLKFEAAVGEVSPKNQKVGPLKIGVVLSGGQAPGGHNVISGLFDFIRKIHPESILIGFLNGPHGVMTGNYTVIDDALMDRYRNMGGFDIIGSGRHKIHTAEQFASSLQHCTELNLSGLVVIGGDDSNTNAALLAEYFKGQGSSIACIGCPKVPLLCLLAPSEVCVMQVFCTD